jgi:hypothetical protein
MSENASATKQTRHVHTRYRFVYEEVEDGRIVVRFVKTEDYKADPYTKNVKSEIYDRSVSDYMMRPSRVSESEVSLLGCFPNPVLFLIVPIRLYTWIADKRLLL